MLKFVIKRFLSAIPVLIIVLLLVFFLMRVMPGDIAHNIAGEEATEEEIESIKKQLGLDKPMAVQFVEYFTGVLKGDLGKSMYNRKPVLQNITARMEPTLLLMLYSTLLSVIIGIPFGILAARNRNKPLDYAVTTFSIFALAVPNFWLGLMMVYYIGVVLKWFPVQGYTTIAKGGIWKSLYCLTMPAITSASGHIASITRYTRSTMLDVLNNDYIKTARSKGLSENKVYYLHALKNSLAPVVTMVGFSMAGMLGGSSVIETTFNIPGMGKLALDSLNRRDYTQEQAIILFVAAIFVFTNIMLDITYKLLDPRIEFD